MTWRDFEYSADCKKLIRIQQKHAVFEKYMETFDLWDAVIKRHVMLTSQSAMLEIGCGLGVPSLMAHLESGCEAYLIDKSVDLDDHCGPTWSNHSIDGGNAYSCNLDITKSFFADNGAAMDKIHFMEKDKFSWDQIPPLDFALSKSSWGVHYHLSEYWNGVAEKLKPGGFVILNFYISKDTHPRGMFANDYYAWLKDRGWKLILIGHTEVDDMKIYKAKRHA